MALPNQKVAGTEGTRNSYICSPNVLGVFIIILLCLLVVQKKY